MALKQKFIRAAVRQAGHPRGVAGRLVGWLFAHRPSNRQRNQWVVSVLDVRPTDRVLEVGFGPGIAIAAFSSRIGESGHVYGIDRSAEMLRQASRRNAAAIRAGRVTLIQAPVERIPSTVDGPLDIILAVNSIGFWSEPAERLRELRERLAPGGRIAIVSQPRVQGATRSTSLAAAKDIENLLESTGFAHARTEILDLEPPVVCVIAASTSDVRA